MEKILDIINDGIKVNYTILWVWLFLIPLAESYKLETFVQFNTSWNTYKMYSI